MRTFTAPLKASLAAAILILGSAPATAADGLGNQAANVLGRFIAQQGNAALVQIRQDIREDFLEKTRALLPTTTPAPVAQDDRKSRKP